MLPHDVIDKDDNDVAPIKFLPGVDDHIVLRFVWSVVVAVADVVGGDWGVEDEDWEVCVMRREANFGTSSSPSSSSSFASSLPLLLPLDPSFILVVVKPPTPP